MNLESAWRVVLTKRSRSDRRSTLRKRLEVSGFTDFHKRVAIESETKDTRGYFSVPVRLHALQIRLLLREAKSKKKDLWLIEDDVVFQEGFRERAESLNAPDDWGILYFGCLHHRPPVRENGSLVRCTRPFDTHCVLFRQNVFKEVRMGLRGSGNGTSGDLYSDVVIADFGIRSYAAYPNLAWQMPSFSDISQDHHCNYSETGEQMIWRENLKDI